VTGNFSFVPKSASELLPWKSPQESHLRDSCRLGCGSCNSKDALNYSAKKQKSVSVPESDASLQCLQ